MKPSLKRLRGMSASAAYGQVGFKPHRANAATLARKKHISVRVAELQEEQLAIHKQATAGTLALTGGPDSVAQRRFRYAHIQTLD